MNERSEGATTYAECHDLHWPGPHYRNLTTFFSSPPLALLRRRQSNQLCHCLGGADEGRDKGGGCIDPSRTVVPQPSEPGRLPDEMLYLDAEFVVVQVRSNPICGLLIACISKSGSLVPSLSDLSRVWRWCIVWNQLPGSEERAFV